MQTGGHVAEQVGDKTGECESCQVYNKQINSPLMKWVEPARKVCGLAG